MEYRNGILILDGGTMIQLSAEEAAGLEAYAAMMFTSAIQRGEQIEIIKRKKRRK